MPNLENVQGQACFASQISGYLKFRFMFKFMFTS